ncbi:MAG: hypothetical protein HZA51_07230 [Planctomycetes bacterium]|nr:hypothetical protein [Planctomycetota bacterium]
MLRSNSSGSAFATFAVLSLICCAQAFGGQPVEVDQGYLDTFNLTDGRVLDIGALGGGLEGQPGVHKITVSPQPTSPSPPFPVDGRLTGTVHGKLRVVFLGDRNADGFINGGDLDAAFDVTWELIGYDKNAGPSSAFFRQSSNPGPEGTPPPFGNPPSVNFPPTPGGTASVWNIAACDGTGFNPGSGNSFCNQFAIPAATPFTGFVDYTFPVSIPGVNDFTPGPTVGPTNWIFTALVGNTSDAVGGVISYGRNALFNPQIGVTESLTDLFAPALLLNFPGEDANIPKANLLASVQIEVTPEPATGLLVIGGLLVALRRRSAR